MNTYYRLKTGVLLACILLLVSTASIAKNKTYKSNEDEPYPFYVGALLGYGTTTWKYLINHEIVTTTPIHVNEGGVAGGVFLGYEFAPQFAIEGLYVRFPEAGIDFHYWSNYRLKYHITHVDSKTQTFSMYGKFMAPIPKTRVRAYALAGASLTTRKDMLAKTHTLLGPVFGAGFNYRATDRLMSDIGFMYYAGYAKSEFWVADDFIPFLYTAHATLSYRFSLL